METRAASVCACIIVRDEERRLPAALASVAFCDEVVVVDSGSRDRTVELARAAGARVVEHPWRGFGAQRNIAIDATGADWILEIDADERVTPRLRAEIEAFLAGAPEDVDICAVPLRDLLLGGRLGPSAKYPKYRLRLFRRGRYRHDEQVRVHEGLWAFGRTWAFEGDLEHVLAETPREALRDVWSYARLEAEQLSGPVSASDRVRGIALRPPAKFVLPAGRRRGLARRLAGPVQDRAGLRRGRARLDARPRRRQCRRRRRATTPSRASGAARCGCWRSPPGRGTPSGAAGWLRAARAAGADVALVTDSPAAADGDLHVRPLARLTPLRLIRALDAETQLRGVDALVPCGPRERRLARLLPQELRAPFGTLDPATDPVEAERLVRAATR